MSDRKLKQLSDRARNPAHQPISAYAMLGLVMPRYFFNVHDNGPPEWDDVGREFTWREDVESHAMILIKAARARQQLRGDIGVTTTVIVHYEEGSVVLTAMARPGRHVQFAWPPD